MAGDSGTAPSQPSDPGLAGERTTLAWVRMGLGLLGLPSALLAYSVGKETLAAVAAGAAGLLGLLVLTAALVGQRTDPDILRVGLRLASLEVFATGCSVLLIAVAAIALVGPWS